MWSYFKLQPIANNLRLLSFKKLIHNLFQPIRIRAVFNMGVSIFDIWLELQNTIHPGIHFSLNVIDDNPPHLVAMCS